MRRRRERNRGGGIEGGRKGERERKTRGRENVLREITKSSSLLQNTASCSIICFLHAY